jgi:hypothetical protein
VVVVLWSGEERRSDRRFGAREEKDAERPSEVRVLEGGGFIGAVWKWL